MNIYLDACTSKKKRKNFVVKMSEQLRKPKCNDKAKIYREKGNTHYAKSTRVEFFKAMKFYNISICFARTNSEDMAMGYAGRAAALFHLGKPVRCLNNIRLARQQTECSADLLEKLRKRERGCAFIKMQNKVCTCCCNLRPHIELDYSQHETVPSLTQCLKLHQESDGTCFVTTKSNLAARKIISVETAYCMTMDDSMRYSHCDFCSVCLMDEVVPCNGCTIVVYCSESCRDKADADYHSIECTVIDLIYEKLTSPLLRLCFRLFMRGWCAFGTLQNLVAFDKEYRDGSAEDTTMFDIDFNKGEEIKSSEFMAIYCQPKHQLQGAKKLMEDDLMLRVWAADLAGVLRALLRQQKIDSDELFQDGMLVLGACMRLMMNTVEIEHVECATKIKSSPTLALFSFCPLLGGPDAPNVKALILDNRCVIRTIKPIKRGQRIVITNKEGECAISTVPTGLF